MNTEIFIEGHNADVSSDISALITYAIDDIKDFGAKNTSYSKTIVLPGTGNNNRLFGSIFDASVSNAYDSALPNVLTNFNAAKSARCLIFQGNMQVFKGVLRLTKIIIDKGAKEYEVNVLGELGGLVAAMGNKKLQDLDFSAYNLAYTVANIAASWNNTPGSGVYFPLMDYGTYSASKHDWQYGTFRPALYLKEYIDKIFTAANFTYDCVLFGTSRFKSIVIPHNQKQLVKQASSLLDVSKTTATTFTQADGYNTPLLVPMPSHLTLGNFTANGASTQFTYTPTAAISGTMKYKVTGTYTKSDPSIYIFFELLINGSPGGFGSIYIFGVPNTAGSFDSGFLSSFATIHHNDVVSIGVLYGGTTGTFSVSVDTISLNFDAGANALVPIALGETIPINDSIPQNILQKDFFSSILKLWNLYVYDDRFDERKLNIAPYIDFYDTDPSTANDWSYKLNRDKPIQIDPLSEFNARYYEFKYKSDSDFFNDQYKKRYNEGYGDRIYDSGYEFAEEKHSLEVIFSGTPLLGYLGQDKVYSTIFKLSGSVEESIDSNIRLLQTKKVIGVSSWNILDSTTVLGSYTDYGYAGHLDDPDAPGNDLNFGVPKELYFTLVAGNLTVNQFNVYYSPYLAEITDKDSKMLTAYFRLTPKDINELDFSKFKYIDGGLYRLNRIIEYNTSNEDECKVELLRVINTLY
jgi:hypothetical protein